MGYTLTFLMLFKEIMILTSALLLSLSMLVIILGQIVAYFEKWRKFDALYWTFITATTVGYGDIRPLRKISRVISIIIAFVGIMFTGIVVAITLEAARIAFESHVDPAVIEEIVKRID